MRILGLSWRLLTSLHPLQKRRITLLLTLAQNSHRQKSNKLETLRNINHGENRTIQIKWEKSTSNLNIEQNKTKIIRSFCLVLYLFKGFWEVKRNVTSSIYFTFKDHSKSLNVETMQQPKKSNGGFFSLNNCGKKTVPRRNAAQKDPGLLSNGIHRVGKCGHWWPHSTLQFNESRRFSSELFCREHL